MPLSESPRTWALVAHPELRPYLDAVVRGDWSAVREALDGAATQSDRTFLLRLGGAEQGVENWLVGSDVGDPDAEVLLAYREVQRAWEVRTRAPAADLSREQWHAFRAGLVDAERRLVRLVADHPDHADAWVLRLTTARGLELAPSEAERRWGRVAALSPTNLWAHLEMLTYWSPMWFGSSERALAFAHESARGAAPGSPLRTLPAHAHLMHWFHLGGGDAGTHYLQRPDVAAEIADAVREGPGHHDHVRPLGWPETENTFAMIQSLAEAEAFAAHHFAAAGDLVTEYPWYLLQGTPREQFDTRRQRAMNGRRR